MQRLHDVELQLVMHLLPLVTVLAFARCCRQTLAAASHSHAWPHVVFFPPLLDAAGNMRHVPNVKGRIEGSLLRFAKKRGMCLRQSWRGEVNNRVKALLEIPGLSIVRNHSGMGNNQVFDAMLTPVFAGKIKEFAQFLHWVTLEGWVRLLHAQPNMETLLIMLSPVRYSKLLGFPFIYPNIKHLSLMSSSAEEDGIVQRLDHTFPALIGLVLYESSEAGAVLVPWAEIKLPGTTRHLQVSMKGFDDLEWELLPILFPMVRKFRLKLITDSCADPKPATWINLFQALKANPEIAIELSFSSACTLRVLKWAVEDGSEFVREAFPARFTLAISTKDAHRYHKQRKEHRANCCCHGCNT